MTALAGFWAVRSNVDPEDACERMLAAQAVYASAAPAYVTAGEVSLGRRLYALLPEDRYDRGPLQGGGMRWSLVADVRLDNRTELCDQLGIAPQAAAILSDAAVLMAAIERWGETAVGRLEGDFAFAAWDRVEERLILARDFMGARPLHFHRGAGFYAFASMAKGLHALPDVPYAPDESAISRFLALTPGDGTQSYFTGIETLPGGHLCILSRRGVEMRRYWNPSRQPIRLKTPQDYQEALREQMNRAVLVRLRGADGRVASHLSGGLDSAVVTATAARLLSGRGQVTAFTSAPREGFGDLTSGDRFADEGAHAAKLASAYPNIDHQLVRSGAQSPLSALDRNAFLYEAPVLNLCNGVWWDAINDAAKARGLRVLLTGELGNLTFSFAGWERLPQLLAQGRLLKLALEAAALKRHGVRFTRTLSQAIGAYAPQAYWSAFMRWRGRPMDASNHSVAHPAQLEAARSVIEAVGFNLHRQPPKDPFESRMRLLGQIDLGARNKGVLGGWGIDTRDPTTDRRLVELCLRIPMDQYLRGGRPRALARAAFADRVPAMILEETRKGLQAADWYEGFTAAREEAAAQVERLGELDAASRLFDVDRMRQLIRDWPQDGWQTGPVQSAYRLALLRGLSGGHFLRKSLGAN